MDSNDISIIITLVIFTLWFIGAAVAMDIWTRLLTSRYDCDESLLDDLCPITFNSARLLSLTLSWLLVIILLIYSRINK